MKTRCLTLVLACILPAASPGAAIFFSLDTDPNGTGTVDFAVTSKVGFPGSPVMTFGRSIPVDAGGATFTDPSTGTTWIGSGNHNPPGHSLGFNPGSTGNAFAFTFSTVGLQDLTIRLDYRGAGTAPPSAFSTFTYNINATGAVAVPGADLSLNSNGVYNEWSFDLSSLTAINDQASVKLRWSLPDIPSGTSFRVDNALVTAIPEPASGLLLALASLGLLRRHRR